MLTASCFSFSEDASGDRRVRVRPQAASFAAASLKVELATVVRARLRC